MNPYVYVVEKVPPNQGGPVPVHAGFVLEDCLAWMRDQVAKSPHPDGTKWDGPQTLRGANWWLVVIKVPCLWPAGVPFPFPPKLPEEAP